MMSLTSVLSVRLNAFFGIALAVATICLSPVSQAQEYPTKPIRFVVASQPGGVTDVRARRVAPRLSELLKQNIIVENRPGASTTIAADFVAKSAPDGYTVLFGGNTELVIAPALGMPIKYDPIKDFIPIVQLTQGSPLLVVNAQLGPKTLNELIDWAKARPGQLLCATAGHGSGSHFICELFARSAKIQARPVAYKGSGPALMDTAAGQVHFTHGYLAEVDRQFLQTGKLLPLAALSTHRLEKFPNIPTMGELGHEGMSLRSWIGLFVPAGTPREVVVRLNREVNRLIQEPETTAWLKETGSEIMSSTPEQFGEFARSDLARWKKMSDDLGIKAEQQ